MLHSAGVSVRGPAHEEHQQPNQDALLISGWSAGQIAVVADGLGSRPLSHLGSRAACMSVRRVLRSGKAWNEPSSLLGSIYRDWLGALPIPTAQAATTLLMAACRPDGDCFVAQLGDGLLLYRSQGHFGVLTPERNGFGNQTDALGISRSWSDWHCERLHLNQPGDGVLMMTDGVADDLRPERLEHFFQMVLKECACRSRRNGRKWLHEQLQGWPTPGHSDDKTIALIFRGSK
jgi:serine/threonine protein phosphatase PrpC